MTTSFFNVNKARLANLGLAALLLLATLFTLGITTTANAQTSVALPGVTVTSSTVTPPIAPLPAPVGITATGWNTSSMIGQGYTLGGDGKGLVTTLADGIFKLGVEANLAANLQGSCTVDCQYTLSKVSLIGEQISGARSVNQGYGTLSAPVASVAGTNGSFMSSAQIKFNYTPAPTATPATPTSP